jgi:hypothetical protein
MKIAETKPVHRPRTILASSFFLLHSFFA